MYDTPLPTVLRPLLEMVGTAPDADYAAGVYMLTFKNRVVFCADATVNFDPDADALEEIIRYTAELARQFNVKPRAVLLSYSNFSSVDTDSTRAPREVAQCLQWRSCGGFASRG